MNNMLDDMFSNVIEYTVMDCPINGCNHKRFGHDKKECAIDLLVHIGKDHND